MIVLARAVHGDSRVPHSFRSPLPADPFCTLVPLLTGDVCGVELLLPAYGTALTGGPSNTHFCVHLQSTLASRFLEKETRSAAQQVHNPNQRKQRHRPHSLFEKGTVTTSTDGCTTGRHTEEPTESPTLLTSASEQRTSKLP